MKKLFIALLLIVATVGAEAQTKLYMKSTTYPANTLDTVAGNTTRTQRIVLTDYNDVVTIQPTFTRISGTAGGTATLQGSINGVGWSTIGSAYTVTNLASQTTSFSVNPSIYNYYQIVYAGTGTMSVSFTTPVMARKK